MRITILGTRGHPASDSGFETAVEHVATRLSARGHEVIVYCRERVLEPEPIGYSGTRLLHLRTVRNRYLDVLSHACLSAAHVALVTKPDVALFFIAGNSPLCLITRWASIPTVINVGTVDSDRSESPALARAYRRFAERVAPRWSDEAITDSRAVAELFQRRYGQRIGVVPTGVEDPGHDGTETLERFGLEARRYILFVGRLEPEDNPNLLVEAFSRIPRQRARGMKLVIVDGGPRPGDCIRQLMRSADPRVIFPGYVFERGYWELQRHAYLVCAPTELGGPRPVVLEAMAAGNCVLVNDYRPEVETVGEAGIYFSGRAGAEDLTVKLDRLLDDPAIVAEYRSRARTQARNYSWETVTDQYEELLTAVCRARGPGHLPDFMLDHEQVPLD